MIRLKGKTFEGEWVEFEINEVCSMPYSNRVYLILTKEYIDPATIQPADDPCKTLTEAKDRWEVIDEGWTQRLKVFGGWLVRYDNEVIENDPNQGRVSGWQWRSCMVFVPDPNHEWIVQK